MFVGISENKASVSVEDHGIGVAPEDHRRIFQKFARAVTSKVVGGLGLGLYISNEIIEAHRGHISLDSRVGNGAKFTVFIPLI